MRDYPGKSKPVAMEFPSNTLPVEYIVSYSPIYSNKTNGGSIVVHGDSINHCWQCLMKSGTLRSGGDYGICEDLPMTVDNRTKRSYCTKDLTL